MCNVSFSHPCHLHHHDYGKLHLRSSCSPIQRHYIQPRLVQKVTVNAGVLLSDATVLSSPWSPNVVLGERVLHTLISCMVCHRIPFTCSIMFAFGTFENMLYIIRRAVPSKVHSLRARQTRDLPIASPACYQLGHDRLDMGGKNTESVAL